MLNLERLRTERRTVDIAADNPELIFLITA